MKTYQQSEIKEIVAALERGEVVAVPTETVYGLAVKYDDPKAIEKLMKIKDRAVDSGKVFTLMTAEVYQLSNFAKMSCLAEQIAMDYLPGPLTLVLPKNPDFSNYYFDNFDTIGLRVPDYAFMLKLLSKAGPLIVTSANRRGEAPILSSKIVSEVLPEVDAVVAGSAGGQKPSTVAQIIDNKIRILREGEISLNDELKRSSCKNFFTLE